MRWIPRGRSRHLEDRRSRGLGGPIGIGGGLITLLLALLFGPGILTNSDDGSLDQPNGTVGLSPADSAAEEPLVQFVSFVLDDVQQTWQGAFDRSGVAYRPARLVLFRNGTESACGIGQSAMGPFYCPLDERVYLDLGFFQELDDRFGAPGDFAQAYVIAHELGHHVQHLQGIDAQVREAQQADPRRANALSVRLELQADCYAGVWGHAAAQRGRLEPGDIDEGLGAASAVGDDRLQRQATGTVNPESFTHGSARERASWFRRGFERGDPAACNTLR